ncbi:hypothetical protein IHE45_04G040700 [Dioscorea alata]|uniref:Uncharacterized protein n=1 Tax=Dioscorea alata TaxID=55571 RepID=A0ACB7WCB2_DIOAL|nr:hypothetical protein IHE45_04G040700 [Dioscorea alata]
MAINWRSTQVTQLPQCFLSRSRLEAKLECAAMAEYSASIPLNRDADPEDPERSSPNSSARKACFAVLQSWISRKFMTGCVVLFPVAITFFITWSFIQFVDDFFSPLYANLGVHIFDQNTSAFKEVAIVCHPRVGEYAFGFITSSVVLQSNEGNQDLCSVYVPTNHLYIGDIFLVKSEDIIRPNLSIREGIEIIVSGGMTVPHTLTSLGRTSHWNQSMPMNRITET